MKFPLVILLLLTTSIGVSAQSVDARFHADSLIQLFPTLSERERSTAFTSTFSKNIVLKDIEAALEFTDHIRKYAEIEKDTILLAGAEILHSEYHWRKGEYQQGIERALSGVELASTNNKFQNVQAQGLMTVGSIQFFSGNSLKAVDYYKQAAELFKQVGERQAYISVTSNIGAVYADYGDREKSENYLDSALVYLGNVISLKDEAQRNLYLAALGNSGYIYVVKKDYPKARNTYALWEAEEAEVPNVTARASQYVTIGIMHTNLGNLSLAENYLRRGLQYAVELDAKQRLVEYYEELARLMEVKESFDQALRFSKKSWQLKDSIFSLEKVNAINELETKYQTAEKEKEILSANATIEKNQRFQVFLTVTLVLVVILFTTVFLFIRQRFRLKGQLLSHEIDNLRLQINVLIGKKSPEVSINITDVNHNLKETLSEREFDILQLALTDKTNREIADEIFVSVNTVKYHLKNIYEKLGVSNRKEALQYVIKPSNK
ncbi:MAG: LuxR C-terminal-related transcriptional regulator [Cyclobacteriaceae bacterium]